MGKQSTRYERGNGEIYEPHEADPDALTRLCPVCHADVGAWCGGVGDVHTERVQPSDTTKPA